jgi:8-oxo-dGTP pyrophosphatase MutT (NUDIX family)
MKCRRGYAASILQELPMTLSSKLDDHAATGAGEEAIIAQFRELLTEPACFLRSNLEAHFTGAAWLVSGDGQRALLTHHRKLNRWLQLGGHADGDTDLMRVALREAEEESGLPDLEIESEIFDLDRHWIPERKDVPGHWHYDVRFVVHARGSQEFVVSEESHALAWREIAVIAADPDLDPSLRRMALRWRERQRREL